MTPDQEDDIRDTGNGLINRPPGDSLPMDRYMAAPAVEKLGEAEAKAMPPMANFNAAHAELAMTPEERALYMRHLGNVTGPGGVDHPDGGRSTLYQMSTEIGNKIYNIPTVWDGKIVKPEMALKLAFMEGIDKFPSYSAADEAEARYMAMHKYMDADIAAARGARR